LINLAFCLSPELIKVSKDEKNNNNLGTRSCRSTKYCATGPLPSEKKKTKKKEKGRKKKENQPAESVIYSLNALKVSRHENTPSTQSVEGDSGFLSNS